MLWAEATAGWLTVCPSAYPKSSKGITLSPAILFLLLLSPLTEHDGSVLSIVHFSRSHFLVQYPGYMTHRRSQGGWINGATQGLQSSLESTESGTLTATTAERHS